MTLPDISQINREAIITGLYELATGIILPVAVPKK